MDTKAFIIATNGRLTFNNPVFDIPKDMTRSTHTTASQNQEPMILRILLGSRDVL